MNARQMWNLFDFSSSSSSNWLSAISADMSISSNKSENAGHVMDVVALGDKNLNSIS